jgi:hypothetical protein
MLMVLLPTKAEPTSKEVSHIHLSLSAIELPLQTRSQLKGFAFVFAGISMPGRDERALEATFWPVRCVRCMLHNHIVSSPYKHGRLLDHRPTQRRRCGLLRSCSCLRCSLGFAKRRILRRLRWSVVSNLMAQISTKDREYFSQ